MLFFIQHKNKKATLLTTKKVKNTFEHYSAVTYSTFSQV